MNNYIFETYGINPIVTKLELTSQQQESLMSDLLTFSEIKFLEFINKKTKHGKI